MAARNRMVDQSDLSAKDGVWTFRIATHES